ncbi:uncharacterized protein EV422DRAFT_511735 [Fimicolochytrium jonesii]|uniref:uncharacterized protein n=1 Tax=Fimicolochytrium jonesii TaxID=1396493 RepID=UPI0022FEEB71|nr:uncharacterized protein EV422DRAFT_511735 [Fimicolochytrium jonesii]KAI8826863.1 hypothetical protein EV422DRAFT_511735 [Fimicolochytrium jonesii]
MFAGCATSVYATVLFLTRNAGLRRYMYVQEEKQLRTGLQRYSRDITNYIQPISEAGRGHANHESVVHRNSTQLTKGQHYAAVYKTFHSLDLRLLHPLLSRRRNSLHRVRPSHPGPRHGNQPHLPHPHPPSRQTRHIRCTPRVRPQLPPAGVRVDVGPPDIEQPVVVGPFPVAERVGRGSEEVFCGAGEGAGGVGPGAAKPTTTILPSPVFLASLTASLKVSTWNLSFFRPSQKSTGLMIMAFPQHVLAGAHRSTDFHHHPRSLLATCECVSWCVRHV